MKVLLVTMPFGAPDRPALGLSLLQAALRRDGHECDVAYLNLAFAHRIGWEDYWCLLRDVPYTSLACEWVFAQALFGEGRLPDSYVDDVLRRQWTLDDGVIDVVRRARALADPFLDEVVAEVDWAHYSVVGFTTVAQQNLASLALACRIKARHPPARVIMGGHAWEWPMGLELHRHFPFVDIAFLGEADSTLPELVKCLPNGEGAERIPGLVLRAHGDTRCTGPTRLIAPLDALPTPSFEDYRMARRLRETPPHVVPVVPFEASRGCWWAAREPCGFCGLNGSKRSYRSKTASRMDRELRSLAQDWPDAVIDMVDNVVPETFLQQVLPELATRLLGVPFAFATRPSVTEAQIRSMQYAGASLQCGIESLSDGLLKKMGKGADALENVRLLKWCTTYGVEIAWNLLYAVPEETVSDYREMTEMIPLLAHLRPPDSCAPVLLERFSRYFAQPASAGIGHMRPARAYSYIYPFSSDVIGHVAYFFDHDGPAEVDRPGYIHRLRHHVSRWHQATAAGAGLWAKPSERRDELILRDTRPGARSGAIALRGEVRRLYEDCRDIAELDQLCAARDADGGDGAGGREQIRLLLDDLVDKGLMVRAADRYLSLALWSAEAS